MSKSLFRVGFKFVDRSTHEIQANFLPVNMTGFTVFAEIVMIENLLCCTGDKGNIVVYCSSLSRY
jgi:hypothetical protein